MPHYIDRFIEMRVGKGAAAVGLAGCTLSLIQSRIRRSKASPLLCCRRLCN